MEYNIGLEQNKETFGHSFILPRTVYVQEQVPMFPLLSVAVAIIVCVPMGNLPSDRLTVTVNVLSMLSVAVGVVHIIVA